MIAIVLGALIVGFSLGLLGSGGSILTVPILVYLLGHEGKVAIAESLAIVGGIALAGALPHAWHRRLDGRSVAAFGIPSMVGAVAGAEGARVVPASVQLTTFAVVMLAAAVMMVRHRVPTEASPRRDVGRIAFDGVAVGALTGFVGVGGGFLIVPALVLMGGLDIHRAVATSLAIIALKSFAGYWRLADVLRDAGLSVDVGTIVGFVGIGVAGTIAGRRVGSRLDGRALRRGFAAALVVVALAMLAREVPALIGA